MQWGSGAKLGSNSMSSAAAKLPASLAAYADLEALPEDVRAELIDGEIITEPAPLPEHGRAQRIIGSRIGGPYDDDDGRGGPGGWWIFLDVDVRFDERRVLRPDLAGWRRERLPQPNCARSISRRTGCAKSSVRPAVRAIVFARR